MDTEFAVGDRVVVTGDTLASYGNIGKHGVVLEVLFLERTIYVLRMDDSQPGSTIWRVADKLRKE